MKTGGRNSALTANRPASGYLPEIQTAESGDMISCTLAESIKKMRDLGFKYRDQAVLCRGNDNSQS